ncbi:AraC family transcriptional regulator [Cohnella thermotolerans]|uniref:AraC family transcriptional regulator n=1 Tax=Cohnella thermotolerans TaxID=329858 RepID=UPI0003F57B2F|nr:helix-turn-helix transcriptional regulator [Cohnella thermotolerans]
MEEEVLWHYRPQLIHHHVWTRKEQFLLAEDLYDQWVAFGVEEGSFHYRIGEQEGIGQFGQLILCPPGTPFIRETLSPLSFHFVQFAFIHTGPDHDGSPETDIPWGALVFNDVKRLSNTYACMRRAAENVSPHSFAWRSHLLQDLWFQLCSERSRLTDDATLLIGDDRMMNEAARRIYDLAFTKLSLRQIASDCGLSPVQFTRRFRQAFQIKPSDYLKSIRLRKALSLLTGTDQTLEEIASQCGFDNGFYLSRVFSETYHVSPSRYRKTHRV